MRTMTFNVKEGHFALDRFENIGDYVEVAEVKTMPTQIIQNMKCYRFLVLLTLSCNFAKSEFVEFYTFICSHKRVMQELVGESEVCSLCAYKCKKGFWFKSRVLI